MDRKAKRKVVNKQIEGISRGFITIATGKEKYHKMAYTLMNAYRHTTNEPYRFGVITDRESQYTKEFDDVILICNASKSYLDKISLLVNSPYDETIFIDADCIAYGDLNSYWERFGEATDMSAFGYVLRPDDAKGWFQNENVGKYKEKIIYSLDFHGGVYFFRKNDITRSIYATCLDIIRDYSQYKFKGFQSPADEPIFALAMSLHNCKTVEPNVDDYAWLKNTQNLKVDFFKGKLEYEFEKRNTKQGKLLHFGTSRTILPIYLIESKKVLFRTKTQRDWNFLEYMSNYILSYCQSMILIGVHARKLLSKRKKI